jgi:hypothetical protein
MTMHYAVDPRVSNWTLATATMPGERHVYPTITQSATRRSMPDARS